MTRERRWARSHVPRLTTAVIPLVMAISAGAQTLDSALIAAIRRGPSSATLRGESTTVTMVGSPTLPLLEVRINGRGPYRLLIDIGSNVTLLRRNVVDATSTTVLVERATSDVIRIDSIVIGGAVFTGVTGASYDQLDVDGVLGFNLLRSFSFTMNYPGKLFSFHRDSLPAPNGRDVLPYELIGRMPFVRAITGTDTLLLNFDTGAAEWMTVPLAWRDSLRWETEPSGGPTVSNNQTGATRVLVARLQAPLRIGDVIVERASVYLNPDADGAWLGSGLLQHFTLTFDTRHGRVKLVPASGKTLKAP